MEWRAGERHRVATAVTLVALSAVVACSSEAPVGRPAETTATGVPTAAADVAAPCRTLAFRGATYRLYQSPPDIEPGVGAPLGTAHGQKCGANRSMEIRVFTYMEEPVAAAITAREGQRAFVYARDE